MSQEMNWRSLHELPRAVITVSDQVHVESVDTSGPAIKKMLEKDFIVGDVIIVPDEADIIADAMKRAIDEEGMDMVVTTGGTGLSARDVTPEATRSVIERDLPGFAEVMRLESYRITPRAIISRAVCGIRGKSIIINLPGSEGGRGMPRLRYRRHPHAG